jgi:hypothetical protein
MKVQENTPTQSTHLSGTSNPAAPAATNRLMNDPSVVQGGVVGSASGAQETSGVPEIPDPDTVANVNLKFSDEQMMNLQDLLMWIATMAAEYIKQQNELNISKQKSIETGYNASMESAQKNYSKNLAQAIVGIIGSAVSLAASSFSAVKLAQVRGNVSNVREMAKQSQPPKTEGVKVETKGLDAKMEIDLRLNTTVIDNASAVGQTANTLAQAGSGIATGITGAVTAGQEYDAKAQEALAQLIAKTVDSIANNQGSTRANIEKFTTELMASLKAFISSSTR